MTAQASSKSSKNATRKFSDLTRVLPRQHALHRVGLLRLAAGDTYVHRIGRTLGCDHSTCRSMSCLMHFLHFIQIARSSYVKDGTCCAACTPAFLGRGVLATRDAPHRSSRTVPRLAERCWLVRCSRYTGTESSRIQYGFFMQPGSNVTIASRFCCRPYVLAQTVDRSSLCRVYYQKSIARGFMNRKSLAAGATDFLSCMQEQFLYAASSKG